MEMSPAGILYIVPTPVGNLEDMTLRAVQVLKEADLILAEDTRTTSVLLQHFDIRGKQLLSHHKFNEHQTVALIRDRILAGASVALVSDAGTPGISDPGFLLARTCAEEGIPVQTLPGATACIPAIVSSGLPCDRFCFEGFLPQKKGRATLLAALAAEPRTMVFYESPRPGRSGRAPSRARSPSCTRSTSGAALPRCWRISRRWSPKGKSCWSWAAGVTTRPASIATNTRTRTSAGRHL